MTAKTLMDTLAARKTELEQERAAIDAAARPLYEEMQKLQAEEEALRLRIREVGARIKAAEGARRAEISRELAVIARATSRATPDALAAQEAARA